MKPDMKGLTSAQYRTNVTKYGLNQLPEAKPPSKLKILISQFLNPLVLVLLVAALLTVAIGFISHEGEVDFTEFIGIMLVVIINGALGYFQENQAEDTLQALTQTIKPHCVVIRDGERKTILVSELTVGDVVELKLGDKVPADGVIFKSTDISANESILTGESDPVQKEAYQSEINLESSEDIEEKHFLYMGTSVMSGIGKMVVTQIAAQTKFGQIADSLINQETSDTPLQARLKQFTRALTILILALSSLIAVWGILKGLDVVEILDIAISVAVSTIPEGLVVALTVILALGMRRILKRNAVVRKLVAAETLGSVDTICIDKTGTLTLGRMEVLQTFFNDQDLGMRALLATNHQVNSVEIATNKWLKSRMTARQEAEFKQEEYNDFKIFDSTSKFSATAGSENTYYVGAPEVILQNTDLGDKDKQHWEDEILKLSTKGIRLIAVGYSPSLENKFSTKEVPKGIRWIGLVGIEDPIRPNLKKVFEQAYEAGIQVKVITGDYGETARAVMERIGIDLQSDEMVSGKELAELSDEQLVVALKKVQLFYRTTPQQKLRIITSLQSQGHVVAMMGDGINDTPALKKAEIGIVVENATDFSKEIADMVLLDSNFKTIIAAVEEGRNIFENMRKVIAYLLSDAFDALVIILGSLALGYQLPLIPLQILYINFVADGLPDLALAFEKPEHEVMKDKPKPKDYPLVDAEVRSMVITVGLVVASAMLGLYSILLSQGVALHYARTLIFATVGINSLVYVFPIRSFRKNLWHMNPFSNKLLNLGVLIGFVSIFAAIYVPFLQHILETVPLIAADWIIVLGIALVDVLIIELIKIRFISKH